MDHAERATFSPREAAVYLGISYDSLNRLIKADTLPVRGAGEKGGKRLILRRDLDAYLNALPMYEPRTREKSA